MAELTNNCEFYLFYIWKELNIMYTNIKILKIYR